MSLTFHGVSELVMDAKFRLTVPTRHREAFADGGGMMLTVHPDGCLLLYPKLRWDDIATRLNALSAFNRQVREWQRLIIGHAEQAELDAAGRILLNPVLRRRASLTLESKVAFVGQGHRCEIWDLGRFNNEIDAALATASENGPPGAENFTL
jgi:MraZ protein